jgi:hypothetical protein
MKMSHGLEVTGHGPEMKQGGCTASVLISYS